MSTPLDTARLRRENLAFAGTHGISARNRASGFLPAFRDTDSGRIELARFRDGRLAPMHLIEGLPLEWAEALDGTGRIVAIKASVVSGFVRHGRFLTRKEAASLTECS